jgi:hypothetical protein
VKICRSEDPLRFGSPEGDMGAAKKNLITKENAERKYKVEGKCREEVEVPKFQNKSKRRGRLA